MADKELRKMNRTELIEIIYALQQDEQKLRRENEQLTSELDDKVVRIKNSGSIAEAALSLNRIFEDAQNAADQYLDSVKENADDTDMDRDKTAAEADQRATEIINEAEKKADQIVSAAKEEAARTHEECEKERASVAKERERFLSQARDILITNPELAEKMFGDEVKGEGT